MKKKRVIKINKNKLGLDMDVREYYWTQKLVLVAFIIFLIAAHTQVFVVLAGLQFRVTPITVIATLAAIINYFIFNCGALYGLKKEQMAALLIFPILIILLDFVIWYFIANMVPVKFNTTSYLIYLLFYSMYAGSCYYSLTVIEFVAVDLPLIDVIAQGFADPIIEEGELKIDQ